jgi:hypothetical protein
LEDNFSSELPSEAPAAAPPACSALPGQGKGKGAVPGNKGKGRGRATPPPSRDGIGSGKGNKAPRTGSKGTGGKVQKQCRGCWKMFPADIFPCGSEFCWSDKRALDNIYKAAKNQCQLDWWNQNRFDDNKRTILLDSYREKHPEVGCATCWSSFDVARLLSRGTGDAAQSHAAPDALKPFPSTLLRRCASPPPMRRVAIFDPIRDIGSGLCS